MHIQKRFFVKIGQKIQRLEKTRKAMAKIMYGNSIYIWATQVIFNTLNLKKKVIGMSYHLYGLLKLEDVVYVVTIPQSPLTRPG